MRYFLDISYVGTRYAGWQIQNNALGVQAVINKALSEVLRTETSCFGSGRTDTGVHAIQQIVQFDTETTIEPFRWLLHLNTVLPYDIVANQVQRVKEDASARFDAIERSYVYKISSVRDPFLYERVLFLYKALDLDIMNRAAQILLLHEDFESFSKVHTDVNHFRCTIKKAVWERKEGVSLFTITANRFLRGMVRTIVGTLIDVGLHKINLEQFEEIILLKDRKKAGQAVSPDGLYLAKVVYPETIYLEV